MNTKRLSLISIAAGLSIVASACGSSTKAAAPAATTAAPVATVASTVAATTAAPTTVAAAMADMTKNNFGPGCAAVPASGSGSFDGMAKDPSATAASNNPLLSTLVATVKAAGLVDTLNSAGPFTIFAPVNDAFAKIDKATIDKLLADPKGDLTKILTYHVVAGKKMSAEDLVKAGTVKTVNGGELTIAKSGDTFKVNGAATVICGNVQTANGTVFIIDSVLLPKADAAAPAPLSATAPFGPACSSVPATGSGSFDGMAKDPAATAASNNPALSTLVATVKAAGLVDTLNSAGPFTIFAPTNDAFGKIDKATIDKLLADPKGDLTKILTYHVIAGKKMSADDLVKAGAVTTVNGGSLTVTKSGDTYIVNGKSNVVCGNVQTANAVVYIIDSVLLPS